MKKTLFSTLSFIMALVMILSAFAACAKKDPLTPPTPGTNTDGETSSSEGSENATQPGGPQGNESETKPGEAETNPGESETDPTQDGTRPQAPAGEIEATHSDLINHTNSLSNGVQAYFTDASRTHYSLQNKVMTMNYSRSSANDQLVESIKNTSGHAYIEQTMDVFVRMSDGSTHYASKSAKSAEANLYRFGFYYYEALFQFQDFVPKEYTVTDQTEISMDNYNKDNSHNVARKKSGGINYFTVTDVNDPYFAITGLNLDTAKYDTLVIKAKTVGECSGGELFIAVGDKWFNQAQSSSFSLTTDGEFHTYYINLGAYKNYEGTLKALRFDLGASVGEGIAIESMHIGNAQLDSGIPSDLKINRHFHVYSDKMHHTIQFAALATTENIAEVGMLTKINANTVEKLVVVDKNGAHNTIEGVDWESAVSVGFDIKDAGVFGYIMPLDDAAGKIKVTLTDGVYVIEQTRAPENGVINPSIGGTNDLGNYIHASGVKNNGNDFWLGQRIYTDENHDFDEFLLQTYFERNPLTEKNIRINANASDTATFGGYDALRGIYVINSTGHTDFYKAYNQPNKDFKVQFNVVALEEDRDFYMMVTASGILECSVLMTGDLLMLPIPMEVIKNFSEPTGERNLFNIDDPGFGESIFCLTTKKGVKYEYTVTNLYQNWGIYPLKQLSQIPFFCPYYHLSTGVTETNCILPWFGTANVGKGGAGNTLPDFRSMSAPFWQGQPQHNSCGNHYWLQYTDSNGKSYAYENTADYITSHGPTYAEVVMENISDDGKIKVTYTHMEMPQLDENRTYYTMEFEVLEELTINDFKHNFQFYKVTDRDSQGSYKKIGYLDENNECQVIDATQDSKAPIEKVLGKECPYFSFFMMPDWNRSDSSVEGYSNVAFLVHSSDFTIGGEKVDPNFYIVNTKNFVSISLNLDDVTLKAGDKLTVNAIVMPWGSQQYEDGKIDLTATPPNYEYDMVVNEATGELYMDKNVRDVRENTLLNPLTATSTTDEIIESPFLPRIKSKDGKSAQFTLSGGENNVTVRAYGFDMLTAPVVEELVNGEWVEYVTSSKNTPDKNGYYHYYDGYSVQYDGNGQYSYSFVVTMKDGAPRTFRVTADKEFEGWPRENLPVANEDLLKVYADASEIFSSAGLSPNMYGVPVLNMDDAIGEYVSVFINPENKSEAYSTYYTAGADLAETGQYLVIMYRVPKTNTETLGSMELWCKTEEGGLKGKEDNMGITPKATGEWMVEIFDLSKTSNNLKNFKESDDNTFHARTLRLDIFNAQYSDPTTHIDFAFIGLESSLKAICELEAIKNNFEFVTLYENGTPVTISVESGDKYVPTYVHPSSGYTQSELFFGSTIDFINGNPVSLNSYKRKANIAIYKGASIKKDMTIQLHGWAAVADGGISKYVWSADGGKTWHDCVGSDSFPDADDAILKNAFSGISYTYTSADAKNGKFQKSSNCTLVIDLSAYEGKTVDVTLAAVPVSDTSTLVTLYCFEDVKCFFDSPFVEGSQYAESSKPFAAQTDFINGAGKYLISCTTEGVAAGSISAKDDYTVMVSGWAAVDSGVTKYLWTADKGATWHEIENTASSPTPNNDDIMEYGQKKAGSTFTNYERSKANGRFQGASTGLVMDLSAYKDSSEPLEIYFTALPQDESDRVVILFKFTVTMP